MNMSPGWAGLLVEAGHAAIHWRDLGDIGAADAAIMEFARDEGWVIVTHDIDFGMLLASSGAVLPSVVQIRSDRLDEPTLKEILLRTLTLARLEVEGGAIVTIDVARARIRVLPIVVEGR